MAGVLRAGRGKMLLWLEHCVSSFRKVAVSRVGLVFVEHPLMQPGDDNDDDDVKRIIIYI